MAQSRQPTGRGGTGKRDRLIGTWLDDRYLIEERIATGGFGAIYRARTVGGTAVAVKVLHPSLTGDPNMVARFHREGATLTQLHDPHTVRTLAVGKTGGGTSYIAMELLTGESLHARLEREHALPWPAAVAIAQAVCSSLAEAHALGVVHRDLKPANIHVESGGGAEVVKVIDFGIVKIAPGSAVDDGQELTFAGHMIGTYDYMSPEQIVGGTCEAASDLYSLGVVLYEMLTGRRPFAPLPGPTATMTALLTQTPQPPSALAALPPALDRIVLRCLEREPDQRFAGVAELAAALDRVLALCPGARPDDITEAYPVLLRIESASPRLDDDPEVPVIHEIHEVAPIDDAPRDGQDRTVDDAAYLLPCAVGIDAIDAHAGGERPRTCPGRSIDANPGRERPRTFGGPSLDAIACGEQLQTLPGPWMMAMTDAEAARIANGTSVDAIAHGPVARSSQTAIEPPARGSTRDAIAARPDPGFTTRPGVAVATGRPTPARARPTTTPPARPMTPAPGRPMAPPPPPPLTLRLPRPAPFPTAAPALRARAATAAILIAAAVLAGLAAFLLATSL